MCQQVAHLRGRIPNLLKWVTFGPIKCNKRPKAINTSSPFIFLIFFDDIDIVRLLMEHECSLEKLRLIVALKRWLRGRYDSLVVVCMS